MRKRRPCHVEAQNTPAICPILGIKPKPHPQLLRCSAHGMEKALLSFLFRTEPNTAQGRAYESLQSRVKAVSRKIQEMVIIWTLTYRQRHSPFGD